MATTFAFQAREEKNWKYIDGDNSKCACLSLSNLLNLIQFLKKCKKNGRKLNAGKKTSDETKNKKKFLYISSVVVVGANKQFILYLRSKKKIFKIFYLKNK